MHQADALGILALVFFFLEADACCTVNTTLDQLLSVMVNLDHQLDRILNHLRDKPLSML